MNALYDMNVMFCSFKTLAIPVAPGPGHLVSIIELVDVIMALGCLCEACHAYNRRPSMLAYPAIPTRSIFVDDDILSTVNSWI